jgi:hypothetical protein
VGQKMVRFSDLSGDIISQDDDLARIVIHEHPELGGAPVEIEVLSREALAVQDAALDVTIVELFLPGEDEPVRVAMDVAAFDKLATEKAMSELLITARPARRAARTAPAAPPRTDSNYATLENAGKPHKGKITDAEQQLVREHFDEINERLASQGLRTISLADASHVERYGLTELAAERAVKADGVKNDGVKADSVKTDSVKNDRKTDGAKSDGAVTDTSVQDKVAVAVA